MPLFDFLFLNPKLVDQMERLDMEDVEYGRQPCQMSIWPTECLLEGSWRTYLHFAHLNGCRAPAMCLFY